MIYQQQILNKSSMNSKKKMIELKFKSTKCEYNFKRTKVNSKLFNRKNMNFWQYGNKTNMIFNEFNL